MIARRPTRNPLVAGCLLTASLLVTGVAPAGADPPTVEGPFVEVFPDVNPCTGLVHTVTISATFRVHHHDGMEVVIGDSVVSTSSGFSGQGRSSFVGNGQVERFQVHDMLTNDAGDRIMAKGLFVYDVSADTVRVESFELTCV